MMDQELQTIGLRVATELATVMELVIGATKGCKQSAWNLRTYVNRDYQFLIGSPDDIKALCEVSSR